jgi:Na+/citrate or Na+/malate symporter
MSIKVNYGRTLRTLALTGLLLIALLGAVLGSIGAKGPAWLWTCIPGAFLAARV